LLSTFLFWGAALFANSAAGAAATGAADELPTTAVLAGCVAATLLIVPPACSYTVLGIEITASNMPALQKRFTMSFPSGLELLYRLRPVKHKLTFVTYNYKPLTKLFCRSPISSRNEYY